MFVTLPSVQAFLVLSILSFATINLMCMIYAHLYYSEALQKLGMTSRWGVTAVGGGVCPDWGDAAYATWGTAIPMLIGTALLYLIGPKTKETKKATTIKRKRLHPIFSKLKDKCSAPPKGDTKVHFWSLLVILVPCFYIVYLGIVTKPPTLLGLKSLGAQIMAMQIVLAGDAAVVSLSFFLIPVAKHSVWLEALGMDATHALVFHRLAGWISLVFTLIHGIAFMLLYGARGVIQRSGFWTTMWKKLIPPAECWSSKILWEDISGTMPIEDTAKDTRGGGDDFLPTTIHSSQDCQGYYLNFTGLVSMVGFMFLAMTSIPAFRRYWYSLFYNVHVAAGWIMMLGAILHFPSVGAFMVPGMIYYIAMSVPTYVQQFLSSRRQRRDSFTSLLHVKELEDSNGCYELEFQTAKPQTVPHAFVKLCVPLISSQWHPFSIVSTNNPHTFRILFRATGPFTKAMARATMGDQTIKEASPPNILVDAFYPEGSHWLPMAGNHDCLLMVAGGVGIVPFLSFLPSLIRQLRQQRQREKGDSNLTDSDCHVDEMSSLNPKKKCQQKLILHWYCREVGLARHVQEVYFDDWIRKLDDDENSSMFRLLIVIHITSLSINRKGLSTSVEDVEGSTVLSRVSDLMKSSKPDRKLVFPTEVQAPLETVRWTYGRYGLAVRGMVCLLGLGIYLWQYPKVSVERRHDTAIRIYGLGYTLAIAMGVALFAEVFVLWSSQRKRSDSRTRYELVERDVSDTDPSNIIVQHPTSSSISIQIMLGRPDMETISASVREASHPGLYLCGPSKLRESVMCAVEKDRKGTSSKGQCAVYDNLSEM